MQRDYPILDGLSCLGRWISRLPEYSPQELRRMRFPTRLTFYDSKPVHDCCGLTIFNEPLEAGRLPRFGLCPEGDYASLRVILIVVRIHFADGPGVFRLQGEVDQPIYAINDYHRVSYLF